ncbi:malto-oligosyltrehalose trehalohydrolase [Hydrogenophaga sp. BPS33]|uniref:malto-oligosyltrehalose trehalohydrolase n=1 Tax=Hydrogenophaga sp. BPS33 TaxID=2651974 RepID=UPI00132023BD|nr:malto-oligosyltrehalose trehalohydrolase [Hydrogenophaga sp. BPS33]QHE86640.1 malto-oligosyltrehalose trehalohydrolase [Hydrogenophaga sp. BPS33]
MKHQHTMPFGATLRPEGGAEFRLWAPDAQEPVLVYRNAHDNLCRVTARCEGDGLWHCSVNDADAHTLYEWEVNGGQRVPDPASRHNPHGPMGPSRVTDPLAFEWDAGWRGRPWCDAVIYEMHVGTFTAQGTFAAAAQRLAQLSDLGVTAIELMPVAAFPGQFGWGYDGVLPYAPHSAYGAPDELKAFVQSAHRLGLMVFLDVVYNHFGPQGNFLDRYAPQFFSDTHKSPWGAALNFDGAGSHSVRDFFIHNALYWIQEFRFDGLRLDAVHAIEDRSAPDVIDELSQRVRETTAGRHVHLILENEKNERRRLAATPQPGHFDAQWNDDFHHALHVLLTGERQGYYGDYAHAPLDLLARALTHGFVFKETTRLEGGRRASCSPAPAQPLGAMVNFVNNHDQVGNRAFGERLDQLAPPGAIELALLLALLTPATPMLFQGDERAADTPFLYFANWDGELREAVRAGRRREFGHEETPGHPLPDPCSEATFQASALPWSQARGEARQALVRAALAVRREWIAPRQAALNHGAHAARRVGATGLHVRWHYTTGPALLLDINLGDEPVEGTVLEPSGRLQTVFAHNRPDAHGSWPAWSARWRVWEPT